MATDEVARLVAVVEANISKFTKGMDEAKRVADRRFGEIEKRANQANRSFANFGGAGLSSLIARYTSAGAIIAATQRIVRESIEVNDQAAQSWARLEETLSKLAFTAGPAVAGFFDGLSEVIQRDIKDIEKLIEVWRRLTQFAGVSSGLGPRFPNSPLLTGATFDAQGKNWRPGPLGFPTPGVTDVTPAKGKADKPVDLVAAINMTEAIHDLERQFLDTLHAEQAFVSEQFLAGRALENEAAANVREAVDAIAELKKEADKVEAERIAQRISEIGDAFEYLGQAAFQGGDAFKRALAQMAQSLALSGLRSLFESALGALTGGGGTVGNLIAGRASGGRVNAGQPYVVGERRPELFVPDTAGTIIPKLPNVVPASARPGSMSVQVVQNMTLAANGDAQVAAIAQRAAAQGAQAAVKTVQRILPEMMIRAQRDRL